MISIQTTRVAYTGDGVTVDFPVTFPFFAASDLVVTERTIATGAETAKAEGTDYSVAGGNGLTGTVTASSAPDATVQWIIRRTTPATQTKDFVSNEALPAEELEAALDRAVMRDLEMGERLARSLRFPETDDPSLVAMLPNSVDRAEKFLYFDASGNPTVSSGVTSTAIVLPVSLANGGTGATSAAAARTALAAAGLGDNNVFTGTAEFQGAFSLSSVDPDAGIAPRINLDRNSPSPAVNDVLGMLAYRGKDSGGNTETYATIHALIVDPVDGSEDARLRIQTMVAGALSTRGYIGAGLVMGAPSGDDKGTGTGNFEALYEQGVSLQWKIRHARLEHTAPANTDGGTSVADTWTKRTLTEAFDPDGIVSVASSVFTLGLGTYRIRFAGTFSGGSGDSDGQLRIRNTTDGTTVGRSTNTGTMNAVAENNLVHGSCQVTIAGNKNFELQYYHTVAVANVGLGSPINSGESELYAWVEIEKVA